MTLSIQRPLPSIEVVLVRGPLLPPFNIPEFILIRLFLKASLDFYFRTFLDVFTLIECKHIGVIC